MGLLPTVVFLLLVVPVVAIVCRSVVEARREPDHDRPMIDTTGSGGGV
jgi:hypothetical protein